MAETKVLFLYLLFLVFFNLFIGMFIVGSDSINISDYMYVTQMRETLLANEMWFTSLVAWVLVPFLLFDGIIGLVLLLSVSFSAVPVYLNIIIYAPLTYFVIFDYVIPTIRGN